MAAKSVEVTEEEEEVVVVEDAGVVVFFLVGFNGTEEVVGLCFGIDLAEWRSEIERHGRV